MLQIVLSAIVISELVLSSWPANRGRHTGLSFQCRNLELVSQVPPARSAATAVAVSFFGPLLPWACTTACLLLAEADIQAIDAEAGFDAVDGARSRHRSAIG